MFLKVLIFSGVILLSGCSQTTTQNIHKEKSYQLNSVMHQLYNAIDTQNKSELELDDTKIRYAHSISKMIKEFSQESKAASKKELGEYASKNMELFEKNLIQLEQKAYEIEDIASRYEVDKLNGKISELKNICNRCHSDLGVKNETIF